MRSGPGTGFAISADGSVIVGENSLAGAVRWPTPSTIEVLGGQSAYGVSFDGSVVVGRGDVTAFRWTESNGVQDLGTLSEGFSSEARGTSGN